MTQDIDKLLTALAAYESKCGIPLESILDSLWYDYSCRTPIDDGQLRASEAKLSPVFGELSPDASDSLSDLIANLLTAYQRAAYLDGMRTGVHLFQELT